MRKHDYYRAVSLAVLVRKRLEAWGVGDLAMTVTYYRGRLCLRVSAPDARPPGPFAPEISRTLAVDLKRPVVGDNTDWRTVLVFVDPLPELPEVIPFPGIQPGVLRIGVSVLGEEVALPLNEEGHLLIAGMTRFGKTNLLRGLAIQARAQGLETLFCDAGQAKEFPADKRAALDDVLTLLRDVLANPRPCLVLIDEVNALVGMYDKKIIDPLNRLAWTGAQKGIHLVLATQDPIRALLGRAPDQALVRMAFKLENPAAARAAGVPEAWYLPPIKGRFYIVQPRGWCGVGQAYLFGDGNTAQSLPAQGNAGLVEGDNAPVPDSDSGGV